MKVGMPAVNRSLVELVYPRFGDAPCYIVHDSESGLTEVVENRCRLTGRQGDVVGVAALDQLGAEVLVAGTMTDAQLTTAYGYGMRVHSGFSGTCLDALAVAAEARLDAVADRPPPSMRSFRFLSEAHTFQGDNVQYSDWDFLRPLDAQDGAPSNWVDPVDFRSGAYLLTVEVSEIPAVREPVELEFGMFNRGPDDDPARLERVSYGQYCRITCPGTYRHVAAVLDMEVTTTAGAEAEWRWESAWFEPFVLMKPFGQTPYPLSVSVTVDLMARVR